MPIYRYKGRDIEGTAVSGEIDASNQDAVAEQLMNQGIIPVQIQQGAGSSELGAEIKKLFTPTVPLEALVMYCRQLYSLTKAGVPLLRSMKG